MSFDQGLIPLYTTEFSTNMELLLQQTDSKLRGRVREGFHTGKTASPINQVASMTMKAPAGRFAPINREDATYVRRWVMPSEKENSQLVDNFDLVQTLVDPKSSLVESFVAAVKRAWDDEIIAQATATATLGQDASAFTNETFDTSKYQVAATFGSGSTASGLTLAKIIETKRIFRHNHVDLESDPVTVVCGSQQESDLWNQVQFTSTEFRNSAIFDSMGRVTRFAGVDLVYSERLPETTVGSVRGVLAFVKSGMHLGIWKDLETNVDPRVDLSSRPWQVATRAMFGATRLQPGKVVQILCADTTGADINP